MIRQAAGGRPAGQAAPGISMASKSLKAQPLMKIAGEAAGRGRREAVSSRGLLEIPRIQPVQRAAERGGLSQAAGRGAMIKVNLGCGRRGESRGARSKKPRICQKKPK